MTRLFLHFSSPSRHTAIAEVLSHWPGLELAETKDTAEAALCEHAPLSGLPCLVLDSFPQQWGGFSRRLQQLLAQAEDGEFAVGPYSCSPLDRCLYKEDRSEQARLTEKEVRLLRALKEAGPQGLGRDSLLNSVWGYSSALDTHTLETHIYRLRQKMESDPEQPRYLVTMDGGYQLGEDIA
jgi:DNA-binding winged helix-turn-helix (wHTH) protein